MWILTLGLYLFTLKFILSFFEISEGVWCNQFLLDMTATAQAKRVYLAQVILVSKLHSQVHGLVDWVLHQVPGCSLTSHVVEVYTVKHVIKTTCV